MNIKLRKLHISMLTISILLCCFLLCLIGAKATDVNNVSVNSASLVSANSSIDGMVRVYLSSLGSPSKLSLTIAGNYSTSDGVSLTNGEVVTIEFNSSTGNISFTRNSVTTNEGTSFSFRRHSSTGTNGIKIAQGRKPNNPYPGDITFKAIYQSGGYYKLYTIAYIYIEDYLYGVLPYEMGNSAPIEALKAQAVAARTYTIRKMTARQSYTYDVVDTTSDQVYNGTPTGYANCVSAVNSTKGIVIKNSSSYTATYYSASNGGQTESIYNIWGSSGYSYLNVHDDPFDYSNPSSIVKSAYLYKDCLNSSNNSTLISLLKQKVITELINAGYNATSINTTLNTITDISLNTPKYDSPSKLYTKMDVTLNVTTYNYSNAQEQKDVTVTCNIFSELESVLSMSIQSSTNELWTVKEYGNYFLLQARRYGHGLGLSQRGAMYMGTLGYTYDQILSFYYEDCTRVSQVFTSTILASDSDEEIINQEDATQIDDQEDSCYAIITLSENDSTVAVRNDESATADVIFALSNGAKVDVLSTNDNWTLIKIGEIVGYVKTSCLSIYGEIEEQSQETTQIYGFATVQVSGYLNLRENGSYSASILTCVPNGTILTVFSLGDSFAKIQYGNMVAYACVDYLVFSQTYPLQISEEDSTTDEEQETSDDEQTDDNNQTDDNQNTDDNSGEQTDDESENYETAIVNTEYGSLNMRSQAYAGSLIITTIPKGTTIQLLSKGSVWSEVKYNDYTGYVINVYLKFTSEENQNDESQTPTTAVVTTVSGSLNLRTLPKAGSTIITTIPRNTQIDVISKGDQWSYVQYNSVYGYVMNAFLSFNYSSDEQDEEDSSDDSQAQEDENSDESSQTDDSSTDETGEQNNNDSSQEDENTQNTAVVTTASGSLNLLANVKNEFITYPL